MLHYISHVACHVWGGTWQNLFIFLDKVVELVSGGQDCKKFLDQVAHFFSHILRKFAYFLHTFLHILHKFAQIFPQICTHFAKFTHIFHKFAQILYTFWKSVLPDPLFWTCLYSTDMTWYISWQKYFHGWIDSLSGVKSPVFNILCN